MKKFSNISLLGKILMLSSIDLNPPKRVHAFTLTFAILRWIIENESSFFFTNFTIITYEGKFNYSLRALYNSCWNTKGLGSCAGAGIYSLLASKSYSGFMGSWTYNCVN